MGAPTLPAGRQVGAPIGEMTPIGAPTEPRQNINDTNGAPMEPRRNINDTNRSPNGAPTGIYMKIRIKRIDKSLPLPIYETDGSVGFDLSAREDVVVQPKEIVLIPSNVIVEVPDGYALIVASRSSTPRKHGVMKPHGIGVIDKDYCGPKDEVKIQVYNFTEETVKIEKGTKIAQGLFMRVDRFEFEEIDEVKKNSRGGFGSTDK